MIIRCSVGSYVDHYGSGQFVHLWNDDGPVYGPNGEWELDPDNLQCGGSGFVRPVFSVCKNNCPGGELDFQIEKNIDTIMNININQKCLRK